jgi:hypothetical protein
MGLLELNDGHYVRRRFCIEYKIFERAYENAEQAAVD